MSDLPPPTLESAKKSAAPRDSTVAWKCGGAVLGAVGLVAGARVYGVPSGYHEFWKPFGPVLLAVLALIGANAGALIGLLVSRFRQERAAKSARNSAEPSLTPPQEGGDKPGKQGWRIMAILNAGFYIGGAIGAFGGCIHVAEPPAERKGEYSMGIFLLPMLLLKAIASLAQVIIFATAGAHIGVLIGSLICILRGKR